jgi:hypothetical protein
VHQLITRLLFSLLNTAQHISGILMSIIPLSGAYQLQQQPLFYHRNVVVAVLLAVAGPTMANNTATTTFLW